MDRCPQMGTGGVFFFWGGGVLTWQGGSKRQEHGALPTGAGAGAWHSPGRCLAPGVMPNPSTPAQNTGLPVEEEDGGGAQQPGSRGAQEHQGGGFNREHP